MEKIFYDSEASIMPYWASRIFWDRHPAWLLGRGESGRSDEGKADGPNEDEFMIPGESKRS